MGKRIRLGSSTRGCYISRIIGNVVLHELDIKLREKNMRACRYADDAVIFCKSRKAAERKHLSGFKKFIESKLHLRVNEDKTKSSKSRKPRCSIPRSLASRLKVSKAKKMKFPQYRYFPTVHVKKRKKLRESLRILLDRRAEEG